MSLKKRLGLVRGPHHRGRACLSAFCAGADHAGGLDSTSRSCLDRPVSNRTRVFRRCRRLSLGDGHKPEDVALDAEGKIYAGFEDGRIMVLQPDGTQPRVFANTGGRPLGLIFDREGNLIVADAIKGLLSMNKAGEIKVLADGS